MFLQKLRQAYPDDEIVLVLDGAGAHCKKDQVWPEGIEALPLPAYSPELNPAERWFEQPRARLSNRFFETTQAMEEALTEALRPFWDAPERLARLTEYGWSIENISTMPTS